MLGWTAEHDPGFVTGLLAFRSVAISGTFAVATSMSARTDNSHAAAHQICFQLWLASSLLADALAVAAQSIMARNLASENRWATAERPCIMSLKRFESSS